MKYLLCRTLTLAVLCLLPAGCAGAPAARRTVADSESTVLQTAAQRADPGYVQYLERQSMLGNQVELARVVSGSPLNWQRPASPPWPDVLLQLAGSWLHVNPLALLPESRRSTFATLGNEAFWLLMQKSNLQGVFIAPSLGSGSIWAYSRTRSGYGEDSVQYGFSEAAGKEDDYLRLLQQSNKNRTLLGGDSIPAATGLGPDFFLALRNQREYPGAYCLVDVPKTLWGQLPPVESQWQGKALLDEDIQLLASQELIPKSMRADMLPFAPSHGWAITGEIRGVDGQMRRWLYRYSGSPATPTLNWDDPAKAAQRILSGGIIQSVGLNGGALIGMRLGAFYGLEASAATSLKQPPLMEPARSAAISLSREIRRYGAWAWLRDETPLFFLRDVLYSGPDFALDSVFSPGAEHALLTGDATLLQTMADEALRHGIDIRRLAHVMPGQDGISYALPHLSDIVSRSGSMPEGAGTPGGAPLGPRQASALKTRVLDEMQRKVAEARMDSPPRRGNAVSPATGAALYTTSAGLAALALGSGTAEAVSKEQHGHIMQGHLLLALFKAMQPGLFVLSGQDLAGSLPINWWSMTDSPKDWDPAVTSRGAYALSEALSSVIVTQQGIARAQAIYPPADLQLHDKDSFVSRLSGILDLRSRLTVAGGRLHARFLTNNPGAIALATILPAKDVLPQQQDMHKGASDATEAQIAAAGTVFHVVAEDAPKVSAAALRSARASAALQRRIRTAEAPADPFAPGTSALITVFNFSRSAINENLQLSDSPGLNKILAYGDPVLLAGEGRMHIYGRGLVNVALGPWEAVVIRIGQQ